MLLSECLNLTWKGKLWAFQVSHSHAAPAQFCCKNTLVITCIYFRRHGCRICKVDETVGIGSNVCWPNDPAGLLTCCCDNHRAMLFGQNLKGGIGHDSTSGLGRLQAQKKKKTEKTTNELIDSLTVRNGEEVNNQNCPKGKEITKVFSERSCVPQLPCVLGVASSVPTERRSAKSQCVFTRDQRPQVTFPKERNAASFWTRVWKWLHMYSLRKGLSFRREFLSWFPLSFSSWFPMTGLQDSKGIGHVFLCLKKNRTQRDHLLPDVHVCICQLHERLTRTDGRRSKFLCQLTVKEVGFGRRQSCTTTPTLKDFARQKVLFSAPPSARNRSIISEVTMCGFVGVECSQLLFVNSAVVNCWSNPPPWSHCCDTLSSFLSAFSRLK